MPIKSKTYRDGTVKGVIKVKRKPVDFEVFVRAAMAAGKAPRPTPKRRKRKKPRAKKGD